MPRGGVARGTVLNFSGLLVPVLVQLFTVPLYIRAIGGDRYGVMALVWLLLGYFGFFDLGFGRAIASRIAGLGNAPARRAEVFWTGTGLSVLTGAIGAVLLYALAERLFHNLFAVPPTLLPEVLAALLYMALALPLVTGISALSGALQGCEAFGALNLSQMTGGVLYQLLPLLVALTVSASLPGLVLAAIAGRLVTAGMLLAFCLTRLPAGRPRLAVAEIRPLLGFGGWVTVTGIISPLLTVFDRLVIGALAGMAAVAAYTVPFNLVMRIGALPSSLQNALFPRFAMTTAAEADRLQGRAIRLVACMMTPPLVIGVLLMRGFLKLWLGPALTASAPVGQILILGLWPNMLAFIPFGYLQSRGRPDLPAKFHVAELPPYALALYLLTLHDGAAGAAWAWGGRCLADAILLFGAVRRLPDLAACWPGACLLAVAFAWAREAVALPLYWPGGAVLTVASLLWAFHLLPAEETERLLRLLPARRGAVAR